ncbi:alanine--tRNA ligase [Sulfuracidifex metallicus]|uniref:Alanine--tRNA ligase n=1 Tax=Sulfuracidifex metallicus DSM 6482 = JCM 9184 TaxID=523847 RepID=A0A6A9QIR3_SULME|nr:alanine--tRNA ligase [Sulfuracidifex metallicus]MUN28029.1 alanine--tRNA ligase [Sulfuracidifex metallicus DSM 6482 = JCM 9184]WOE51424.1 alanine--tRNA ligase [Sulfuracidifex metallicus DSM 6482 = JCM 9184]
MQINEREYSLNFFKERDYLRRTCTSCKTPFWSKDKTRQVCSDIPCTDYYFFDISIKSKPLSVKEAREKFISFFKRNGHTPIKPKPVLARWREDLYLTIASIVDFQPHVTSGLVPPPANPLVISQPAIRLEDIDNVGITFGRHLTTFEMAAHHAFNYPDKEVYWKEKTVELATRFFTEELGIPEEQLNFKESWWEGGGNAGPCLEVTVGGLELATLVFMQYKKEDNGEYSPLPLRIVDTGYGVERLAWVTQKTPTAFHAIYGELVYKFFKKVGVDYVDETMLKHASRLAGRIDPDNPETVKKHREAVAKEIGEDVKIVDSELTRAARVFQLLDHSKTVALMLADGLVPSNSGEGYLGRLVMRRAMRVAKLLGSDVRLYELVLEQINFWGEDFPQLSKNKEYILDVVENEQNKFEDLYSKVPSIASSLSKKGVSTEDLIQVYDSNGIPPDMLYEELKKRGIEISVPDNFYALVAKRHQSVSIKGKEKAKLPLDVIKQVRNLPATEKLYYEDQYQREFEARIVKNINGKYMILDRTTFYPEGGGQIGDRGLLHLPEGDIRVIDTQKVENVIVHVLEKEINVPEGTAVKGSIDWESRFRTMRHHTVTHVILASAKKLLGDHVWQAGAEKTPEKGRLDITHHKMLTEEQVREIERMSNHVINDHREVKAIHLSRIEAETKYGDSIYEGGVPNTSTVRLLEIKGWDVEGCGGTHVSNTSEIGGVKILKAEKIQDGVIRLEYVAGDRVSEYATQLEDSIGKVANMIGASPEQLEGRMSRLIEEKAKLERTLQDYRKMYMKEIMKKTEPEKVGNDILLYVFSTIDQEINKDLMKYFTTGNKRIAVSVSGDKIEIASSSDVNLQNVIDALRKAGGKGGGKGTFASFSFKESGNAIDVIRKSLK